MNEWERQRERAKKNAKQYPPGTRIELERMGDDPRPIESGTRGTVLLVDAIGTVHCDFDNGSRLGLVSDEDVFRKLTAEELAEEQAKKEERLVEFGDGCKLKFPKEPIDCSRLGYFDELEDECWRLVKAYCAQFGIGIQPLDEDDAGISFDIAKGIQDHILEAFEEAGVRFKFEEQSEEIAPVQG